MTCDTRAECFAMICITERKSKQTRHLQAPRLGL